MKRFLPILLTLVLAGPTLAQPENDRPGEAEREQMRERLQQRRDQNRDGERQGEPGRPPREGDPRNDDRPDRRPEQRGIPIEELEFALSMLAQFRPDTAKQLREQAQDDPQQVADRIAREYPRIQEFIQMKLDDPARFELHNQSMRVMRETWQLKRQLRAARGEDNEALVEELEGKIREQVAEMFDIRLALRRLELEELRARVQELEAELEEVQENREEHINKKAEEELDANRDRGRRGERDGERDRDRDRDNDDNDRDRNRD